MKKGIIKTGHQSFRARVDSQSFNETDNTVEVVFATNTPVRTWNSQIGYFWEILEISNAAINMERMISGAPVLNTHSRWDLNDVIGVVSKVWIDAEKNEARALVRLSEEEKDVTVVNKIKKGIIRNVSAGYSVEEYTIVSTPEDDIPTYRASKWTPKELSFVPVQADHRSGSRSEDNLTHSTTILNPELMNRNQAGASAEGAQSSPETTENQRAETTPTPAPTPVAVPAGAATVDEDGIRSAAVTAERQRVADITAACTRAGMDQEFTQNLITAGTSVDAARASIIDQIAANANPAPTNQGARVTGEDETDQVRGAVIVGLMHRSAPGSVDNDMKGNERAQTYSRMRMLDIAKERLRAAGQSFSMLSEQEIVKRAWSTSDFPNLLGATAERSLLRYYNAEVPEWRLFARKENAVDFRDKTGIKVDGKFTFEEIKENGEYKSAPVLQDEKMTVRVRKFGRKYSITDMAIINDDLSVFDRLPQLIALGAQQFQSEKVWGLITGNAKASDGKALFHTDHANLAGTGAVLSEASLSAARLALRRQKSPAGNILGIRPKFLIVPPELETTAQKLLSSVLANETSSVNVFANKLDLIVSDALTDTKAWYIAADPRAISAEGLVYSYLTGQEGLHTESRVNFDTDALEVKARLFFDATVWGWQGWYKNPGA